ncbi:MAG TPA: two pore domain potassium channel family protein [Thiothrix sp.]|nr:two pore domain potassium channel family protein [Thiothrix sp.]
MIITASVALTGLLLAIVSAIWIHYESLRYLSVRLSNVPIKPPLRLVLGVFGVFVAHVLEMLVFAVLYLSLIPFERFGGLQGNFPVNFVPNFADAFYFSCITYTSLGFGDIVPTGWIRLIAGLEALLGLVLITWTASFLYLEMTRYWQEH